LVGSCFLPKQFHSLRTASQKCLVHFQKIHLWSSIVDNRLHVSRDHKAVYLLWEHLCYLTHRLTVEAIWHIVVQISIRVVVWVVIQAFAVYVPHLCIANNNSTCWSLNMALMSLSGSIGLPVQACQHLWHTTRSICIVPCEAASFSGSKNSWVTILCTSFQCVHACCTYSLHKW
jgi:hypothetical protein